MDSIVSPDLAVPRSHTGILLTLHLEGQKGKGREARLTFIAPALVENRHGLLADSQVTEATARRSEMLLWYTAL